MKIIEKKCPNCGAQLSFGPEDKETHCNYCGQEFIIDNGSANKNPNEEILAKNIKLHKKVVKSVFAFQKIFFIFFFIIFISIFVITFKNVYSQLSGSPEVTVEQIDETTLEMIHSSTLDTLKQWSGLPSAYAKTDYESIGFYIYKDTFYTRISDVYKIVYTNKKSGKYVNVYTCVNYRDVKEKDGKVTLNYDGTVTTNTITLEDSMFDVVHGYRSVEELYTKEILPEAKGKIFASEGMYR